MSASSVADRAATTGARWRLAMCLMVASGFSALGYQIVWTQQSAMWLGHESAGILAVVAAFFGGLSVGALALGPMVDRSTKPARWYAACEAVIGSWSFALAFLIAPASRWLLDLVGEQPPAGLHWSIAFGGTFVLLFPATAAMGATLPAMERTLAQHMQWHGSSIAALYAGNTIGAVAGVLAAAFWLVPTYGMTHTAALCAVLNLLCAATALALFNDTGTVATRSSDDRTTRRVLWLLAATGLLGIGYEVLVVRVLSQVTENTVYTFAMLLAVYLVGTALGAAWYQRHGPGASAGERTQQMLLWALAAACVFGTMTLWGAEATKAAGLEMFGVSMAGALASEALLAVAAFLLPTLVMGALFSHLASQAHATGVAFGRSLGVNTLGAAAAPGLFGVLALPLLGAKYALALIAAGYLILSIPTVRVAVPIVAVMALGAVLTLMAPPLAFVQVPEGGRVVSYRDGAMASVSVVEDSGGVARLRIDNRQQEGSSATVFADARQALLPLLLHNQPQRALFLGLGTGVTASSAAEDRSLQVDAVELLPEVIEASAYFRDAFADADPRLHLIAADARRFVRATPQHYDLIVSDNFHPARSGSAALYTVEHFRAVRDRLSAEGLFCQWLPLHQLDLDTLRSIVRAFVTVFPNGWAMLATNSLETPVIGLVARNDDRRFDADGARARLAGAELPRSPAEFGIQDEFALFGGFVAGPRALLRFAGDAAINTDDHPVVAYRAPRITYASDSLPQDRLIALLHQVDIVPDELIEGPLDNAWSARLAAYWKARNRFIEVGRGVRPSADAHHMLSQVHDGLLEVLHLSPDFRPAYDPLLQMAIALSIDDAPAARALLAELEQAQPLRPEAGNVLREISQPSP